MGSDHVRFSSVLFPLNNTQQAPFPAGDTAGGRGTTDLTGPAVSFPSPGNLINTVRGP